MDTPQVVPNPDPPELLPDWLRGLALRLARSDTDGSADDLLQDAWLELRRTRRTATAPAWARTLRDVAWRRRRGTERRRSRERATALEHRDRAAPAASDDAEQRDLRLQLARAVSQLAEPFRSTLIAHHGGGLDPREIARADGVTADTVRWRLRRGHALVRAELERRDRRGWEEWRAALLAWAAPAGESVPLSKVALAGAGGWIVKKYVLAAVALVGLGLTWWLVSGDAAKPGPIDALERGVVPATVASEAASMQVEPELGRPEQIVGDVPATAASATITTPTEPVAPFRMARMLPELTGTVVAAPEDGGRPIEDALVAFYPSTAERSVLAALSEHPLAVARTSATGRFRVELPVPATQMLVDLVVVAPGWARWSSRELGAGPEQADLDGGVSVDVTLSRGGMLRGVLMTDLRVEELEVWAVEQQWGRDPISFEGELALRAAERTWEPARELGEHRVRSDVTGFFEITGLDPRRRYWLRVSDPSLRTDDTGPWPADGLGRTIVLEPRPHVEFLVQDARKDFGPWSLSFELQLCDERGTSVELDHRENWSQPVRAVHGAGARIDRSLSRRSLEPHSLEVDELREVTARVVALAPRKAGTLPAGKNLVLAEEDLVAARGERGWRVEIPERAFGKLSEARLSEHVELHQPVQLVSQDARLDGYAIRGHWILPGPKSNRARAVFSDEDRSVWIESSAFPCQLEVHGDWDGVSGPPVRSAWSPDACANDFPPDAILVPLPGALELNMVGEAEHVALAWLDHDGHPREVYRGPQGALTSERLVLPSGAWLVTVRDLGGEDFLHEVRLQAGGVTRVSL